MRWFKKIVRAILALLPLFAIFLIPSNCYALEYQYRGIPISDYFAPPLTSSSPYVIDWTSNDFENSTFSGNHAMILRSKYINRPQLFANKYIWTNNFSYSNNLCNSTSEFGSIRSIFSWREDSDYNEFRIEGGNLTYNGWNPSSNPCYNPTGFGLSGVPSFNQNSISSMSADTSTYGSTYNDFMPLTAWNTIFPYKQSQDILDLESKAVSDSNGFVYESSFNYNRLASFNPAKFESLSISLDDADGFFFHSENLYQGRQLEFKFLFNFKGSFSWNPDLSNGSIDVYVSSFETQDGSSPNNPVAQCTANLQVVSGATHLELTCPLTLSTDFAYIVPVLEIYNPDYVWDTDNIWEFYGAWLTTDGDSTPGGYFNNNPHGNDPIWSPLNGVGGDNSDSISWFDSLSNLFNFSVPTTPLGSIFSGFTDSMACASIPTIASMIHSNETQVCPWFNSSIRNITTPVLSLFAVCLTFGFIVRWLGSSSGNDTVNSGGGL